MKRLIAAAAALFIPGAAYAAETPTYDVLMEQAGAAFEAGDWRTVADALDAAQAQRSYSLFLTRNRILAYAELGEFDRALGVASRIAARGLSIELDGHPGFEALKLLPAYDVIRRRMDENTTPKGDEVSLIGLNDTDLLPETFVKGKKRDRVFVGSVRTGRIVQLAGDHFGNTFATAPGGVYDLEIDGDSLWAAVNSAPPYETAGENSAAGLMEYSLETGELMRSLSAVENALLGDMEKIGIGLVASDSITPRLFVRRKDGAALEIFVEDPRFVNLQGLAYDKRRKKLFVADYLAGLFAVDVKTGAVTALANPSDAHLGGVDGLYIDDGDLVGIQNGTTPQRIVRINLNDDGDVAESLIVLAQNLAGWAEPTNGQIVNDALYYVATSNWPAYGADGAIKEDVERAPVRIMSVDLKR